MVINEYLSQSPFLEAYDMLYEFFFSFLGTMRKSCYDFDWLCWCGSQLASACYVARIDLSAHGFYITPDIGFDWITGKGNPFRYYTYGAAFAEVEVDTLTGDFHTRMVNVFLDLGYSLNPAIDVGQVNSFFLFITCDP